MAKEGPTCELKQEKVLTVNNNSYNIFIIVFFMDTILNQVTIVTYMYL